MKRLLLAAAFCAAATPALALFDQQAPGLVQIVDPTAPGTPLGTVAHPLNTTGTFTGTIGGFPGGSGGVVGTPVSAQTTVTTGSTQSLPTGTSVIASNIGGNMAFCQLGATASVNSQPIPPGGGWFDFTVGSATQITCVTSVATTTVNTFGGGGIATGTGGGGSGSGGTITIGGPLGAQTIGASVAVTPATSSIWNGNLGVQTIANSQAVTPATSSTWQTQESAFIPGSTRITAFTVTSGGVTTSIPGGSTTLIVSTSSSLATIAHCTLGAGPATGDDHALQPGESFMFNVTGASQFSCMTSSGSQLINAVAGSGTMVATGGNGSTVTAAGVTSPNAIGTQFVTGGIPFSSNPGTASLWGLLTQGSTTSGEIGPLMMGAVTTAAPSYTTAQTSPLSLDTAGNLRVNVMAGGGGSTAITGPLGAQTAAASVAATINGTLPAFAATPTFNCGTGCSAFTGTITGPLGSATAATAALSVTDTGTPITGTTLSAGGQGVIGWLSQFAQQMINGSDASSNAKTVTAVNVAPFSCATTVSTGGTPVNLTNLGTATIHGFTIKNDDITHPASGEPIWVNFTGTASATPGDSFAIPPASVTTSYSGSGTFTTPVGFGSNHAVSVYAATSGHIISCVAW